MAIEGFEDKDIAYRNFIESLKSEVTQKGYKIHLFKYCQYVKAASLNELLTQDIQTIKDNVISYILHLRDDKKLSYSFMNLASAAIKHFYEMNEVAGIPWTRIARFKGENRKVNNNDRPYTHEEIKRMLDVADIKYKAIILTYASTGIRREALTTLRYVDIKKVEGLDVYMFTVYSQSHNEHTTFCTPECFNAINRYLETRINAGEILNPDTPLFRKDFNRRELANVKKPRPINITTVSNQIRAISQNASVTKFVPNTETNPTGRRRNEVSVIHAFRKFSITEMGRAKINPEIREMLVNHDIGIRQIYLKYDENDLLAEYVKAIDNLTINEENRLKKKIEELTVKDNEIRELREQFLELKEALKKKPNTINPNLESFV